MDNSMINSLIEALKFSPDNLPLKHHLAQVLKNENRVSEAIEQYKELVKLSPNNSIYKFELAELYYKSGANDVAIIILEEIYESDINYKLLLIKCFIQEKNKEKAINLYKEILSHDPAFKDEFIDNELRISIDFSDDEEEDDNEYEDDYESNSFLEKPDINFEDVGGMHHIKKEIDLKIIKPLEHQDLYKAYGKKIGGGILLYGPPGCGKTFIAKATAGQINSKFISVGLNDILDMWIGNSEKQLHGIFELARRNKPCVLFFDEIDALGASRSDMKQSAGRHLINQFLQELDGIDADNDGILVLGATNTPWHLDPAFRRPGRFDRIIFVPTPDEEARESIFKLNLSKKPIKDINYKDLAKSTESFSGADINAVIDIAIEEKLENSFETGIPEPLTTKDLLKAAKKHKPTTSEWFTIAKNHALFANESGLYDDILTHLKIKK